MIHVLLFLDLVVQVYCTTFHVLNLVRSHPHEVEDATVLQLRSCTAVPLACRAICTATVAMPPHIPYSHISMCTTNFSMHYDLCIELYSSTVYLTGDVLVNLWAIKSDFSKPGKIIKDQKSQVPHSLVGL